MRGKASGDLESLKGEYNSLKDAKISSQKEFAKDPSNAKRMEVLENKSIILNVLKICLGY